jgi:hypothetical protein
MTNEETNEKSASDIQFDIPKEELLKGMAKTLIKVPVRFDWMQKMDAILEYIVSHIK